MRRLLWILLLFPIGMFSLSAQEQTPVPTVDITYELTPDSTLQIAWLRIENRLNPFGELQQVVRGELANPNPTAYTNIELYAYGYAQAGDEESVAEGFGYPVTICGFVPFDYTLPASGQQYFDIPLEIYEELPVTHLIIQAIGSESDVVIESAPLPPAITQISDDEVVSVEFPRNEPARYAVGCEKLPLTTWDWFGYNATTATFNPITHPSLDQITEQARANMRLRDEAEYNHSFISIAPNSRRLVFQTGVNHFYTAQPDGGNRRYVHQDLSRFSLQGIIWTAENEGFLAYYFGAYGEQVRYFTARASSEWISRSVYGGTISYTVPGPNSQGTEVIITTDELGPMGYYAKHTYLSANYLLFEAEPPGNNYPAPVWIQGRGDERAYIARPIDGVPTLQCYHFRSQAVTTLTALPLNLTENDRAWMWVSPDTSVLMLSQNGIAGGLWQVDLTALPECE
jgi:hypothetical protein